MTRRARLGKWLLVASGILLLFWAAAIGGGWSPAIRPLTSSVNGPSVADYRAESPQMLAPLSPAITKDASQDQAAISNSRPTPRPSPSGPNPSASGSGPTPTASLLPSLPVVTPTLPVTTPTVPVATPSLPLATPTPPALNLPLLPRQPTPPPLF